MTKRMTTTTAMAPQVPTLKQNPVNVKLGHKKHFGFYTPVSNTTYTLVQENKMTHNVLKILTRDDFAVHMGMFYSTLSDYLVDVMPDIAVDEYGYSTTLEMLLKDLEMGELITREYNGRSSCKNKITALGIEFLKRNVKVAA